MWLLKYQYIQNWISSSNFCLYFMSLTCSANWPPFHTLPSSFAFCSQHRPRGNLVKLKSDHRIAQNPPLASYLTVPTLYCHITKYPKTRWLQSFHFTQEVMGQESVQFGVGWAGGLVTRWLLHSHACCLQLRGFSPLHEAAYPPGLSLWLWLLK